MQEAGHASGLRKPRSEARVPKTASGEDINRWGSFLIVRGHWWHCWQPCAAARVAGRRVLRCRSSGGKHGLRCAMVSVLGTC
eukprot:scaffold7724_cov323-Prasinococcus_capsulatus_cf.AAC.1